MLKFSKKVIALLLVAMLVMASVVGCAKDKKEALNEDAVLMTIDGVEVAAGVVNFYVRYQQSLMEPVYGNYLGDSVWTQEKEDGVTYGDSMKQAIMDLLQEAYIVASHASEYKVELTKDEETLIESVVKEFEKANKKADLKKVSGSDKYSKEYLEIFTLSHKVGEIIRQDIDTNVSADDEAQKRLRYVAFEKTTVKDGATVDLEGKDLEKVKKEAAAFLKGAKANGSLEAYAKEKEKESTTFTFDKESTGLDTAIITKADAMKENEFAEVIDTDDAYYVVQLESEFDSEATDAAIEEVLESRGETKYQETIKAWKESAKIKVNEKVWAQINLDDIKVNFKNMDDGSEG